MSSTPLTIFTNVPQWVMCGRDPKTVAAAGNNTGNVVFWHATIDFLRGYRDTFLPGSRIVPLSLARTTKGSAHDFAVLVLANNIQEKAASSLDDLRIQLGVLPYVVLSIGAQCAFDQPFTLSSKARAAIARFIIGAVRVFMRGPFTRDVLLAHGVPVTNCVVGGCPAMLACTAQPRKLPVTITKLCIAFPNGNQASSLGCACRDARALLIAAAADARAYALLQDEGADEAMGRKPLASKWPELARVAHGEAFTSRHGLNAFCTTCDAYIGTRIHGALAALRVGTPALLIAVDSRTRELAATLHVEFVEASEFVEVARARSDPFDTCVHILRRSLTRDDYAARSRRRNQMQWDYTRALHLARAHTAQKNAVTTR